MANPGLASLGTGSELQITSNTGSNSTTKYSVYDYTASKTGYAKFNIVFNAGTNGVYNFLLGDGANYSDNAAIGTAQIFAGVRWSLGPSNAVTYNVLNNATWSTTGITDPTLLFEQGVGNVYTIEVFYNNENNSNNYYRESTNHTVNANSWDLWVNGTRVGSNLAKGGLAGNVIIDSWAFNHQISASAPGTIYLDDIEYSNGLPALVLNPSINLSSSNQITADNVNQGATNHIFSTFQAAITDDDATLNTLSFTSAGTYAAASDLSNYRLWYNTANTFGSATNLSTVASGVTTGSTVTFNALNQSILENTTGYFWITADVAPAATTSNTISFTSHSLTFGSGNQSGSISDGGAQTIQSVTPVLVLSSPSPAIAAGNVNQNSTNNVIYGFDLTTTVANTALTALDITTNGNYAALGVANLKAWYSTDATFNAGSDVLLATIANPTTAGVKNFTGINQLLTSGSTAYIFVTVDITCDAADNATIGVDAITTADITTTASESGTANAGGTQTIQEITPDNATALAASVANTQSTVSWTNPTGCLDEVLVVVKAGSSISGTPTGDGSAYTANLDFAGAGTAFDGGKVVYKGTTSGQTVTGLTNGTQYFVKIYSRNGESWSAGVEVDMTPSIILSETFESGVKGSYTAADVTLNSGSWNFNDALLGTLANDKKNGTQSARIQLTGDISMNFNFTDGAGIVSFEYGAYGTDVTATVRLFKSIDNGGNWTQVGADLSANNTAFQSASIAVNESRPVRFRISKTGGLRVNIDDFQILGISTNTWNGTVWSAGQAPQGENVVISGNLTVAAGFTANNLTIDNAITVTLDAGQDLTVNGSFENNGTLDIAANSLTLAGTYSGTGSIRSNGGDIVLNGTSNAGSLSFDQTTDGITNSLANFTLNRTSSGEVSIANKLNITNQLILTNGVLNTGGFVHLKSTSATATASVVGGTNASINGNVTVERFLPWLSANNDGFRFVGHSLRSNPALNTITNLPAGNNTVIRYDEAANSGNGAYIGVNDRTATWSQAEALGVWTNSSTTLSYTGELQLSDVGSVNLSNSGSGWLYIANPFPSVVDYNEVTRNNVNNAKYRWVKDNTGQGNGNWGSYVGGVGSNGGSRKIAPGQGFMVKTTGNGSASISFPASARTTSDTVIFVRTASTGDIFRAAIKKSSNNTGMETVIRFSPMATNAFDEAWDAFFLTDFVNSSPDLYTMDNQGNKYSINSLPELTPQPFMLPLYLDAFETGNYQWSFDDSEMLSTTLVQLEDTKTGLVQTIGAGQTYSFTYATNDAVNRFRLHFNGLATSVAANNLDLIQMYAHEGALYIRGTERAESLRILDISGRTVYSAQQLELDGNAIRPNLAKGTYLVQLVNEMGVKTVKVIF